MLIHKTEFGIDYILSELKKSDQNIDEKLLKKAYETFIKTYGSYDEVDGEYDGLLGQFLKPKPDYAKLLADARKHVRKYVIKKNTTKLEVMSEMKSSII